MARRSPTNRRYQKHGAPKGQTRRSAASARPARASGQEKPVKKKTTVKERYQSAVPQTPEYKKYRKQWWLALGIGALALVISLILSTEKVAEMAGDAGKYASLGLTFIAFVGIAFAWYVDLKKIRPMLKEHQANS